VVFPSRKQGETPREWHPPKEVLNYANIEARDRKGLVQLLSFSCKNLCVAVDDGWNDVLTIKSNKSLMRLILGAGG
jgi:hypothetical protein